MSRDNKVWLVTLLIWGASTIPIFLLWDLHFPNDLIDTLLGFVLYIAAFGWVFLIMPLREFVEFRVFPPPGRDDDQSFL